MLQVFKALSDETRLRLLGILAQGDFNVNELLSVLQMGQSRISRHLKILAESGLVRSRREGNWIYYGIAQRNGDAAIADAVDLAVRAASGLPRHPTDLQRLETVVDSRRTTTRRYFDRVGDNWEAIQDELLNSGAYRERALELMPSGIETAVDLGAGPGRALPGLLRRSRSVVAVDVSKTMLNIASDVVRDRMPERQGDCDFRLGELEHLPLGDATMDGALALMVFHHVSNPQKALSEIHRVLQPGGVLVLADLLEHERVEMREEHADLWLGFNADILRKWLVAAGFRVKELVEHTNDDMLSHFMLRAEKRANEQTHFSE